MITENFQRKESGFREYLTSSVGSMFALDLTKCTVTECIDKMCEIKERSHPKIRQSYRMLANKLGDIEQQFGCTINTLRNIPRSKILRATGHSSEKAFVRYICYDEEN